MEVHDLRAVSLEAVAVRGMQLPFSPPLIELASNEQAVKEIWQMLAFLYPFKDPAAFPQLPEHVVAPHKEILDRYCDQAASLAQSSYLNAQREIHVSFETGEVQADTLPKRRAGRIPGNFPPVLLEARAGVIPQRSQHLSRSSIEIIRGRRGFQSTQAVAESTFTDASTQLESSRGTTSVA